MNHLSIDEIIEFVSSNKLDAEGMEIIRSVNEHIRECSECRKLVQAFQLIYDEFDSMSLQSDFKKYAYNVANLKDDDIKLNGYR